jgi:uncharacterized protein (TIGR02246 family)
MGVSDPRDNHRSFERLWNEGDVDGLVDLYDEAAAYVAGADQILRGHEEIRAMLEESTAMGTNRLELIALTENGDSALERTRWTMTFEAEDGSSTEHSGLSTVVLRRQADRSWRMLIDDPGLA